MTDLHQALDDYLNVRRALGFQLERAGRLLPGFVDYLEEAGASVITTELAVAWASQPPQAHPVWHSKRLTLVRGFAKYVQAIDPATEIPPIDLLPTGRLRVTPYLYSPADIAALIATAGTLNPPLRAATYQTLIGLLAVTGMRVGEAIGLQRGDIDVEQLLLTVHKTKFGKSRELPLHPSAGPALAEYARRRDESFPAGTTTSFFISTRGTPLLYPCVYVVFRDLLDAVGVDAGPGRRRPRIHDLRHTFAVTSLLRWYENGEEVQAKLPLLSTYLGHFDPASTYWYLTASPQLLAQAAGRLEQAIGRQP